MWSTTIKALLWLCFLQTSLDRVYPCVFAKGFLHSALAIDGWWLGYRWLLVLGWFVTMCVTHWPLRAQDASCFKQCMTGHMLLGCMGRVSVTKAQSAHPAIPIGSTSLQLCVYRGMGCLCCMSFVIAAFAFVHIRQKSRSLW